MCLEEIYTDEDMNEIVRGLPEVAPGVVEVWKVACPGIQVFSPIVFYNQSYKSGINFARKKRIQIQHQKTYWTGYHFAKSKKTALNWYGNGPFPHIAIRCYILKEWIASIGKQPGQWNQDIHLTLVASQAFFPTYPETEAKLEGFLAWLKDNDKEYAESQLCEMAVK